MRDPLPEIFSRFFKHSGTKKCVLKYLIAIRSFSRRECCYVAQDDAVSLTLTLQTITTSFYCYGIISHLIACVWDYINMITTIETMERHARHINCYYNTLTAYPRRFDAFASTEQCCLEGVSPVLLDEDVCPPLNVDNR